MEGLTSIYKLFCLEPKHVRAVLAVSPPQSKDSTQKKVHPVCVDSMAALELGIRFAPDTPWDIQTSLLLPRL